MQDHFLRFNLALLAAVCAQSALAVSSPSPAPLPLAGAGLGPLAAGAIVGGVFWLLRRSRNKSNK